VVQRELNASAIEHPIDQRNAENETKNRREKKKGQSALAKEFLSLAGGLGFEAETNPPNILSGVRGSYGGLSAASPPSDGSERCK
jgi:hypothetical protein